MPTLPGGFSPLNAIKQIGSVVNPTGGVANYDVFGNLGDQRTGGEVLGATTGTPEGALSYNPDGTISEFRNGQWVTNYGTQAGENNPQANLNTGITGSGLGSGSTYDPELAALYDNQIGTAQSALGRIGKQKEIGYGNIDKTYNESAALLAGDRSAAEGAYNLQKDRTGQDYTNTRAGIRANAGNQFGSIQRLLGSKGAGRSSAAQILAPFAVGKEAASRFGQVQDQFGRNQQDMDTSYATTTSQFDDYATQLENDKIQKRKDLESGLATTEVGLQDQIGQLNLSRANALGTPLQTALQSIAPQQSRIQELLNSIDEYGRNTSIALKGRGTYKAPELSQYNYSQFSAPQLQGGGYNPQADYVSPLTSLLKKDKKTQ